MSARASATVARMPVEPPSSPWGFPPPAVWPDDDDLVAMGADLAPGTLLRAYRQGLFPMPSGTRRTRPAGVVQPGRARGAAPRRAPGLALAAPRGADLRRARRHRLRRRGPRLLRPAPAGRLDLGGHRGGVHPPPRAGLGAQRRDLAGRPAGRRAVRRRDRRPLRGGVDVPRRAGRVEGGAGRPGRAAPGPVRRTAPPRRAVGHAAPGWSGGGRGDPRATTSRDCGSR